MTSVSEQEFKVLQDLSGRPDFVDLQELALHLQLDQSQVAAAAFQLAEQGHLEVLEEPTLTLRLGKKGLSMAEQALPERSIIVSLSQSGGSAELTACAQAAGLDQKEVGQSLRWLKAKGWAEQEGKALKLLPAGEAALHVQSADEALIQFLASHGESGVKEIEGVDVQEALRLLQGRSGVVEERERKLRRLKLTQDGRDLVAAGLQVKQQVNAITHEMLLTGEWRQAELRPYDVRLASEPTHAAKIHPLVSIFQQTRKVFLELGFSETVSSYVESSFWDFDVLFQPQDHPARDMQDTFYVARPGQCRLPDDDLVARVGQTHKDGGETGSVGWRYTWDREIARKPVLRTHTTASTIRALAQDPRSPRKVFCVGPVFRRETVDYKHLPVFHQVDGIIIDEHASFASLLGTLQAFYRKMGFDKFQFRPAFFPYTEPSVEIFVWSERKQDWVEMGGAGMFRPEVTEPLGCKSPVLAWGLGLERLAMFRYELGSIGELYRARLNWLKETPLCR